jgi:hypothetical protein
MEYYAVKAYNFYAVYRHVPGEVFVRGIVVLNEGLSLLFIYTCSQAPVYRVLCSI